MPNQAVMLETIALKIQGVQKYVIMINFNLSENDGKEL